MTVARIVAGLFVTSVFISSAAMRIDIFRKSDA